VRLVHVLVALLAVLGAAFVGTEWWHTYVAIPDLDRMDPVKTEATLATWAEEVENMPTLDDEDTVQVLYVEHLLASWVLEASPWNAYHSGMAFHVNDKNGKRKGTYTVEYIPVFESSVGYVLHPFVDPVYPEWMPKPLGVVYSRLTASYNLTWQNQGGVRYHKGVPSKFKDRTSVGTTSGKIFNQLVSWLKDYSLHKQAFQPVEIVINGTVGGGIGSCMCHDLFYYALYALQGFGFRPSPSDVIFRDHVVVFAEAYEKVDINDPAVKRDLVRFYRLFISFMDLINEEFGNMRNLLVSADSVGITPYLYHEGEYYRINMLPPYVNYCYLGVQMPPKRATLFNSEHLCALGQSDQAVKANVTWSSLVSHYTSQRNVLYIVDRLASSSTTWLFTMLGIASCLLFGL